MVWLLVFVLSTAPSKSDAVFRTFIRESALSRRTVERRLLHTGFRRSGPPAVANKPGRNGIPKVTVSSVCRERLRILKSDACAPLSAPSREMGDWVLRGRGV